MNGQPDTAFLLTEGELNMLAAVGGLDSLLSFSSAQPAGRVEQTETAYGLLRRGALVQDGGRVRLSDELAPLFGCMGAASSALLLTPRGSAAPQLCLYCAGDRAVSIMPHKTRRDSFRLALTAPDDLPDLLEELGLLPASYMDEPVSAPLRAEDVPAFTLPLGPDGRLRDRETLDEAVLTVLERFSLPEGAVRERALVFRTPVFWGLAVLSDRTEYRPYRREDILKWIRGKSL